MGILSIMFLIIAFILGITKYLYHIINSSSDYDDMFFERVIITDKKDKNYSITGHVQRSFVFFGTKYYEIKLITGEKTAVRSNKVKIYE